MSDNELAMIDDKEFHVKILAEVGAAMAQKDYASAVKVIKWAMDNISSQNKAHCFLLLGEIENAQGKPGKARKEWLKGIPLSRSESFGRLTLELALGRSYEIAGQNEKALDHYLSAVRACAEGERFSGSRALDAYLALNGGKIPQQHHGTFAIAIEKSWNVLEAADEPDLTDLPAAINALSEHFNQLKKRALG